MSTRKAYVRDGVPPPPGTLRMRKCRAAKKNLRPTGLDLDCSQELSLPTATSSTMEGPSPTPTQAAPSTSELEPVSLMLNETSSTITLDAAMEHLSDNFDDPFSPDLNFEDIVGGDQASDPTSSETVPINNSTAIPKTTRPKLLPLCCHTQCTADDIMLMCLSTGFRHNLAWVAIEDVMKMFNVVYGTKKINATKFSLMRRFFDKKKVSGSQNMDSENKCDVVAFHYYCKDCKCYVSKMETVDEVVLCACGSVLSNPVTATYFATISLKAQLKDFFENNPELADSAMSHRFSRVKINEDNLEDIYDGIDYKAHVKDGGILSVPHNFSLSFFTDGVGKSKANFWPIYVTINELPPKFRKRHIFIVGLYHGHGAPNPSMFLKPFVDEVNELSSVGFNWVHRGETVNSKVIPLVGIADSDARYKLLNMKSHKAKNGCTFCYQTQKKTLKGLKYKLPTRKIELRTQGSYDEDVKLALENQCEPRPEDRHGRGVKGVSTVRYLNFFNIARGFPVDYMHAIMIGVTKSYFQHLFEEATCKDKWEEEGTFTPEDVQHAIDERLLQIKPSTCLTRTPRTIADWANWKANEWRAWLLFYAVPCLTGILKHKYVRHIAMLSVGTYILLQKSVSKSDAKYAHQLFQTFVVLYQDYFKEEFMFYNVHLLIHVVPGVLRWGPLSTHNAFVYESFNRTLLNLKKNPFRVVKEVSQKYLIYRALPRLLETFEATDGTTLFCEEVLDMGLIKLGTQDSCHLLGAGCISYDLDDDEKMFLSINFPSKTPWFYHRMRYRGMRITTNQYFEGKKKNNDSVISALDGESNQHFEGKKKNNDSVICTYDGETWEVRAIFELADQTVHILAREVLRGNSELTVTPYLRHIFKVSKNYGVLKVLRPVDVRSQCILMKTTGGTYLSRMPYGCFGD